MRAGIELHGDFDAVGLRALAKAGKDAAQSRRHREKLSKAIVMN